MAEEVKKTAGRPKATVDKKVDNTNEDVMVLLKKMQAELASLKKENDELKKNETPNSTELNSETEIEVMSLFVGTLTLYSEGFGNGTKYPFPDGYGSIIDIPLGDLKDVVKNNNQIAKDGYFYIMNEEAVKICRLKRAYENLIELDKMESLEKLSDDNVIALYNSAPKTQQNTIIEYFASKKANGEKVNRNILFALGEASGRNLSEE